MDKKQDLISKFESGDIPTGIDFEDLINHCFNEDVPLEVDGTTIVINDDGKLEAKVSIDSIDIGLGNYIEETEVPLEFLVGYRSSSNGQLVNNTTTWRTTSLIRNTGNNEYKLNYNFDSVVPGVRILLYSGDTGNQYLTSYTTTVNVGFTVQENVTFFSINLPLTNANPNTNPPLGPMFVTGQAVETVKLVKMEEKQDTLVTNNDLKKSINQVKAMITPSQTLKVLMVGNSFSDDVSNYVHLISNSANVNVVFGNLYMAGETLQGHLNNINSGANVYTYHKRTSLNGVTSHTTTANTNFLTGLRDENWDFVVYQQASSLSGVYSSFNPHLASIIGYVNANKTNANAKNSLHMTWAYPTGSTNSGFSTYNNNQIAMYNSIVDAYLKAMQTHDIDVLIPTGTAIQNARTMSYLQLQNNDMSSDDSHLGNIGDYIGGLTLFETLIASKYNKDIFKDVTYVVESKFLSYLSKVSVKNAILNPFKVSTIGIA